MTRVVYGSRAPQRCDATTRDNAKAAFDRALAAAPNDSDATVYEKALDTTTTAPK